MCGALKLSGIVRANFRLNIAIAMLFLSLTGHLPLMSFILSLAFLGQGLVVKVAWVQQGFKAQEVQNVAAPVVKILDVSNRVIRIMDR